MAFNPLKASGQNHLEVVRDSLRARVVPQLAHIRIGDAAGVQSGGERNVSHHHPSCPEKVGADLPARAGEGRDVLAERLADVPREPVISLKRHLATPQVSGTCPPGFCEAPGSHFTTRPRWDNALAGQAKEGSLALPAKPDGGETALDLVQVAQQHAAVAVPAGPARAAAVERSDRSADGAAGEREERAAAA